MEARGLSAPAGGARLRVGGAPVLMYHGVGGDESRYTVTRAGLALHLDQMRAEGFAVRPLADVWAGGQGARAVVMTFDDGRASDYTDAFPLLRERGLSAEFFVNPATMGRPGFLTWVQAREMAAAGMSLQSHSHDHVYLTRLRAGALHRQMSDSRRAIEDEVGRPPLFLAAPYGDVNRRVVDAALAAGYRAVCTSWPWPSRPRAATVSRVAVYRDTSPALLRRLLAGDPRPYVSQAARAAVVYPAKQALLRFRPGWRRAQREGLA